MKRLNFIKNNQGITLVEGLICVLILSIGIVPSFSVILAANSLSTSIANNLIAANLAQEGVEVVHAIRDANWFVGSSFDSGLADGSYRVVWNSTSLLPESSNPPLKLDSGGFYNYSNGTDTLFKRRILITKIDPLGCNCEIRVIAEVSWVEKKAIKIIRVESHLFDWR